MNNPNSGLVQQLLDTVQKRIESKVLNRLNQGGGETASVASLLEEVISEEQRDLTARAEQARADGEEVQAEMYRLIGSDVLPVAADALRRRMHRP